MIQLRPYQQRLMDETKRAMLLYKHILTVLQQGGGKSFILSFMIKGASEKQSKTLALTHRQEIYKQNSEIVENLNVDFQLITPKTTRLGNKMCHIAMAQTLKSRCETNPEYVEMIKSKDLIIIDEAHRGEFDFIFDYISPETYIVGLTGTPERRGNQTQLGLLWDCIVTEITPNELIKYNHILRSRPFAFQAPKIEDVQWNYGTGDWNQKDMAKLFEKKERYSGVVKNWKRICPGTKTLVFATSGKHCVALTKEFCDAGISAKYLLTSSDQDAGDYEKYSGKREDVLSAYSKGEFAVLVNIDILSTGYNEPSIETVILDMATESYSKYSQAAGRGCRSFEDQKYYYLLDFGGNVEKHGKPEDARRHSLWHNASKGGGIAMTKECPKEKGGCGRLIHIGYTDCPFCHYHFPTDSDIYEVELKEIIGDVKDMSDMTLEQYVANRKLAGWKNDWILKNVCMKNSSNEKEAFMKAIKVLKTGHGENISPKYWAMFKKYKLSPNKKKR